jgi:hypothetical protein
VFQRIRGANLTIKPSKCHLGGREVSVVGHIVGKGQIKVQPDKVRAVKEYLSKSGDFNTGSADNADFKSLNDFSQASLHSTMVALPFLA